MPPRTKKTASEPAAVAAVVAEPVEVVVESTADAATAAVVPNNSIDVITKGIASIATVIKGINAELKVLQKEHNRLLKASTKGRRNNTNNNGVKRKPSGFAKPTKLTPATCVFMGLEEGSEEPRMAITKKLNTYIKENNLQRPDNKKFINPDETLTKLLQLKPNDELSYFNLQQKMSVLFVPKEVVAVV